MSSPNVPDICPIIDITMEDAINLLLVSVALEEISISELISAETRKLEAVLKQCHGQNTRPESILEVNKSIDGTLKNIIKLQMLLQFKLDNVKELIPKTTTTTTTTTTTSTTTTTTCSKTTTTKSTTTTSHTTTCTTSTCSTTTEVNCRCGVMGKAWGWISNSCDRFDRRMAVVKLYSFSDDLTNRSIHYEIGDNCDNFGMVASDGDIRMYCPSPHKMVLYGNGYIRIAAKGRPVLKDCSFTLTLWSGPDRATAFRMETVSREEPLNHHSGIIRNENEEDDSILVFI